MSGVVTAIVVSTIVVGGVVAHDNEVKQNRAIGEMEAQAQAQQDAFDKELADKETGIAAEIAADKERRRTNLRRVNPTGNSGIDDDSALKRRSNNNNVVAMNRGAGGAGRATQATGRNRLLGS